MRAVALLAIALSGCTLVAHDTADLPRCEANADCEAVNARFGINADACMRYQCDPLGDAVCVLGARDDDGDGDPAIDCGGTDCDDADARRRGDRAPGDEERCDGVDEDCDLVIDEGAFADGEPRVFAADVAPAAISAAPDATGALAVALSSGAGAAASVQVHFVGGGSGPIAGSVPLAPEYYTQTEFPGSGDPFTSFTRTAPGVCYEPPAACNMRDAAIGELDPAAGRWLLAAVSDNGCADGQLRVSWVDRGTGEALMMGPPARAAPALGVDASRGGCTGSLSGAADGASQPSLAVLSAASGGPQALLTYLARPVGSACNAAEAEVRAIGLWVTEGTIGGRAVAWVDASNRNEPITLGTSRARARAAVAALDEPPGYLVAHAGPSEIVLTFVPAFETIDDAGVDPSCDPDTECDVPHDTPDIEAVQLGTMPSSGADEVAIAIGAARGGRRELGLVWQTGCGSATTGASFAMASVEPTGAGSLMAGAVHALGGDRAGAPAITYVPEGLVVEGYERGSGAADADHDGGWIVAWREEARLFAQRFSELDGEAIDDPITVAAGVSSRPELAAREGPPALYGVVSTSGELLGGSLGCSSP